MPEPGEQVKPEVPAPAFLNTEAKPSKGQQKALGKCACGRRESRAASGSGSPQVARLLPNARKNSSGLLDQSCDQTLDVEAAAAFAGERGAYIEPNAQRRAALTSPWRRMRGVWEAAVWRKTLRLARVSARPTAGRQSANRRPATTFPASILDRSTHSECRPCRCPGTRRAHASASTRAAWGRQGCL